MRTSFRKSLVELGMCGDLVICGSAVLLTSAMFFRPVWDLDTLSVRHPVKILVLTVLLGAAWHVSFIATKLYRSYRAVRFSKQATALARGTSMASVCFAFWLCMGFSERKIGFETVLLEVLGFWITAFSGLVLTRVLARAFMLFLRRRGRNLRNVLIVGTNARAVLLARRLVESTELGFRISGFVDDHWHDPDAPQEYKDLLLGPSTSFLQLLRELAIDEVIIALPIASCYHYAQQIVDWCRQQGVPVRSDSNLFNASKADLLDSETPAELITHHEARHPEWMVLSKRLIDIVVSGVALALLALPMLVIALVIKMTSKGPALYAQERLGLGKRTFRILKFRTMVVNAEKLMAQVEHLNETQGPTFKLKNDPRITKAGVFLRKTSLDELPQLVNVFLGDMSLVGPRPLPLRDYTGFSDDWHRRRFSVKPGITCIWQIAGRSSIGFDRWMELDLDYIDRWSLGLDFEILVKTIPAVLRGSGAV